MTILPNPRAFARPHQPFVVEKLVPAYRHRHVTLPPARLGRHLLPEIQRQDYELGPALLEVVEAVSEERVPTA